MYRDLEDMRQSLTQILTLENGKVTGFVGDSLPPGAVDALARNAVFHPDPTIRTQLRQVLRSAAAFRGIRLAGLGEAPVGHGVRLAVRLGGHCYDLARLVLRSAGARGAGSVVFEQGWAGQSPWEFSALLAAAALRENWRFPLHLRCCLPPLAGDLLGGGEDVEALGDRLSTASRAELANVTLRVSPAGLLRPRSHGELSSLLRQAREQGQAVSLRVQEPDAEAQSEPVLLDALHSLTRDQAPRLLTLGSGARHWSSERLAAWRRAAGGAGLALSGIHPGGLLDPESAPLPAGLEELRVDFDWATRIVLHPEFLAERRREVLGWLRTHRPDTERLSDAQLLALHEYQALGHFEFELWDLDRMPSFRADFMAMLDQLYTVLGLV